MAKIKNFWNKFSKKAKIVVAGVTALVVTVVGFGIFLIFRNKNKDNNNNPTPTTSTFSNTKTSLDDLGIELPFNNEEKKEFGKTTGGIDVVDNNGKHYVDQEAKDNSVNVGNEVIDNQGGTLEVKPDGTVVEKEDGYEIKDKDGNVSTGTIDENTPINPDGSQTPNSEYAWDEDLQMMVKKEYVGKYMYSDLTFYNEQGEVIVYKGEVILKEKYNEYKKTLLTTPPTTSENKPSDTTPETPKPETSTGTEKEPESTVTTDSYGGTVNADGTYTVDGIKYKDKATFEAIISDEADEVEVERINGVIHLKTKEEAAKKLTLTN